MKKDNLFKKNVKKANPEYFTGLVKMKELSNVINSQEQKIFHVTFKNGSRTKLHYHTGGQILIVTKGKGSLVLYNRFGKNKSSFKIKQTKTILLNTGDVAYIPAKKLHTHGLVNKKQIFSHVAINSFQSKNKAPKTIWFESDFKNKVMKIL